MPDSSPNPAVDAICGLKCANMESCSECRELKQLEAEIVNATRRRARFLVKANERRDTLTSTLPAEVICYIFEAYLDIHRIDTTDQSFQSHRCQARPRLFPVSERRVLLLLGTVCHRWRQLAWSHPQLWSTILIDLACPAYVLGPELVSEWLKRSGNLPLNIRVDDDETQCYHPPGIIDHGKQVMRVLNEHSARWSSIDVSGVALEILAELDDSACLEASVLKHFSFGGHWNDAHPDEPPKTILRTTKRQHRPTHLALLQEMPPSLVKVDWSWLTHLYVTNMSRQWAIDCAARASPSISHLYFNYITDGPFRGDPNWKPASVMSFTSVVFLSIVEVYDLPTMAMDLFSYLALPKLKHLVFDGRRSDTVFPTDQLRGLVRRSEFSMTHLTLSKPIISEGDLIGLLLAMPTIQVLNLKLREANDSTPFLGCLSQKAMRIQSHSPFLPSLVHLDMEAISPEYWSMFVMIFDDHPRVSGPPRETPLRKELKISFFTLLDVNDRSRNYLMDDDSIQKLIHLWRLYGIFIDLKLQGPSSSEVYDLLMVSFDRRLLLHPATQDQKNTLPT